MGRGLKLWFDSLNSWSRLVATAALVRLIGGFLHTLAPITMPHNWRQVDTMATALRYSLRWQVERTDFPWWMPAVLNSGDTRGIMAMEFPLLNLWGGLGFYLAGPNIDLGRHLAQGMFFVAVVTLAFFTSKAWAQNTLVPKRMTSVVYASCIFSFALPYSTKFMPDLCSLLLCFWGLAELWRMRWRSVVLISLGLLMKPTTGVVLALLLLHPAYQRFTKDNLKTAAKQLSLMSASLIAPAIWYLLVCKSLRQLQERTSLFELHSQFAPWSKLLGFWTSAGIWDVLGFHSVFAGGTVVVIGAVLWRVAKRQTDAVFFLKLLGIAILQASVIGALSGDHARLHAYYLIGLSPTVCLLLMVFWDARETRVWLKVVLALGLIARTGEAFVADTMGLWDKRQAQFWFAECRQLREDAPAAPWHQGVVWHTPIEDYPLLDLCLGERGQSETSQWRLVRRESLSSDLGRCRQIAQSERLALLHCED